MNTKVEQIVQEFGTKTDLTNRLSYDSGVKNIVGVNYTSTQIRLRYENNTPADMLYYFAPVDLIGIPTVDVATLLNQNPVEINSLNTFNTIIQDVNLPHGVPFYLNVELSKGGDRAFARSMDDDRKLYILATSMNHTPIQVKNLHFRSFDQFGKPENSNYGNSVTPYNINAYRDKKRRQPINLSAYQSSQDYSTEILKIDLLRNNIILPVSQEDVFTFKVNAFTKLDITMDIGARDSRTERFFRDLQAGTQLLLDKFPNETTSPCSR